MTVQIPARHFFLCLLLLVCRWLPASLGFFFQAHAHRRSISGNKDSEMTCEMSQAPQTSLTITSELPVLIAPTNPGNDAFVRQLCEVLKLNPIYVAPNELSSPEELDSALQGRDASSLFVIDDPKLIAESVLILREAKAIYLMNEDVDIDERTRRAALYDIWLPSSKDENLSLSMETAVQTTMSLFNKLRHVPSSEDTLLDAGLWSHFVSLTFPSVDEALPALKSLRIGADAFELRVDLLTDISVSSLHRQIALLRANCPLPIVFTVRSKGQIGKFPDDEPERMFQLLEEGLRAGCEWIDVEACWSNQLIDHLTSTARNGYASTSRLLGSLHVVAPRTEKQIHQLFVSSSLRNSAHILKVVTGADNDNDCELIHRVGSSFIQEESTTADGYIGVCLGAEGARSRVLNRRFTPVNHPLMETAAPGQKSAQELMDLRQQEGLIPSKKFYLFGTPIGKSLSPAMHNAAFQTLLLPHVYSLNEQEDISSYESVIKDENFGGASVTIPHKESIIPYLHEVRGAASVIGAVNTIVPEVVQKGWAGLLAKRETRLIGYNTDWLGIYRPIMRKLRQRGINWKSDKENDGRRSIGIVVGAGGTARAACYAVKELGLDLVVINRSAEKGADLAERYNGTIMSDLSRLLSDEKSVVHVIISTIPATATYEAPLEILQRHKPVVLDVVYTPARTALIDQAIKNDCLFVQGATMLLEQALEQFQLWNQRRAPRDAMEVAIWNGVEKLDRDPF